MALTGWFRHLFAVLLLCSSLVLAASPAEAGPVDRDVKRYLVSDGPAAVKADASGHTREFDGEALTRGRELFMENCAYCHSNGLTLPFPPVSLTTDDLAGATPPRDNIEGFVEFMRFPMTYDGSEPTVWCREVPESWLSREQLEELAAFTLSAAEKVPGWGTVPSKF